MYGLPYSSKYAVKDEYLHDAQVLANVNRLSYVLPGRIENPVYTAIRKRSELLPTTCH